MYSCRITVAWGPLHRWPIAYREVGVRCLARSVVLLPIIRGVSGYARRTVRAEGRVPPHHAAEMPPAQKRAGSHYLRATAVGWCPGKGQNEPSSTAGCRGAHSPAAKRTRRQRQTLRGKAGRALRRRAEVGRMSPCNTSKHRGTLTHSTRTHETGMYTLAALLKE